MHLSSFTGCKTKQLTVSIFLLPPLPKDMQKVCSSAEYILETAKQGTSVKIDMAVQRYPL